MNHAYKDYIYIYIYAWIANMTKVIIFHLKVLGKCQLQGPLQEKGNDLDSLGNISIFFNMQKVLCFEILIFIKNKRATQLWNMGQIGAWGSGNFSV